MHILKVSDYHFSDRLRSYWPLASGEFNILHTFTPNSAIRALSIPIFLEISNSIQSHNKSIMFCIIFHSEVQ